MPAAVLNQAETGGAAVLRRTKPSTADATATPLAGLRGGSMINDAISSGVGPDVGGRLAEWHRLDQGGPRPGGPRDATTQTRAVTDRDVPPGPPPLDEDSEAFVPKAERRLGDTSRQTITDPGRPVAQGRTMCIYRVAAHGS